MVRAFELNNRSVYRQLIVSVLFHADQPEDDGPEKQHTDKDNLFDEADWPIIENIVCHLNHHVQCTMAHFPDKGLRA